MTAASRFPGLDSWDPAPLRDSLLAGGFHPAGLESLGLPEHWLRSAVRRAALLGHADPGSPAHTLIRLFTLGDPVEGKLALSVLGDAIHGLLDIGFLEAGGGHVRSRHQLVPIGGEWIACDFHQRQAEEVDDYVMGIGPSSTLIASLVPPVEGRVLELACGIGWLAGSLAKAGRSVTGTDLNRRALDLGHFSARLRGIPGLDLRLGDGFAPVSGERFDLIVANPPYVQSPGGGMTYKEAPAGDSLCARLLRQVPDHLAPGGIAVVLIHWTHADDDDWAAAPLSWVDPAGTRRWLFQTDCSSPADYAWKWISSDLRFRDDAAAEREILRWLAHYRAIGARRVSGGFIVVQKCPVGGEWTRTDSRAAGSPGVRAGHELLRVVDNETWLATAPDLLATRFAVPDGLAAEARMSLGESGWARETIRLTSPGALAYDGQVDENILRLLALAREGRPAADMVAELRSSSAIPDLPERITALVRELVAHGILIPA